MEFWSLYSNNFCIKVNTVFLQVILRTDQKVPWSKSEDAQKRVNCWASFMQCLVSPSPMGQSSAGRQNVSNKHNESFYIFFKDSSFFPCTVLKEV